MSLFSYNDIIIEVIKTDNVEMTPIYDGNNYLYTRYRISISGVYNGAATSYKRTGVEDEPNNQRASIGRQKGWLPSTTLLAVREKLLQPRRRLLFTDDFGNIIIQSPENNSSVDSNNGPKPIRCDVKIKGSVTYHVKFVVETFVNEQYAYTNSAFDSSLKSHSWRMIESIDEKHRTVRVVEGRATFDAEYLRRLDKVPDDFRKHLFPDPPSKFRRTISITAQEDGKTITYRITDRSSKWHYKKSGIVDVKVNETIRQQVGDAFIGFDNIASAFGRGATAGGAVANIPGAVVGGLAGIGLMIAESMIPTAQVSFSIRVYGDTQITIAEVSKVANSILNYRKAFLNRRLAQGQIDALDTFGVFSSSVTESQDVDENSVSITATFIASIGTRGVLLGANIFGNNRRSRVSQLLQTNLDDAEPNVATATQGRTVQGAGVPLKDDGSRQDTSVSIRSVPAQDSAFSRQSPEDLLRPAQQTQDPHVDP